MRNAKTKQNRNDVTILGAGIVGVCCALSLQEKGYQVTLVDRASPGEAASYGNAGVISPWSCVPQCMPGTLKQIPGWLMDPDGPVAFRWRDLPTTLPWVYRFLSNAKISKVESIADSMTALMRDNVGMYQNFLKNTDHVNLLQPSMHVNAYRGDATPSLDDLAFRLRRERGAMIDLVRGEELRDVEPALGEEFHTAVLIRDQARAMAPGRLCQVLGEKALQQGARLVRARVSHLESLPGGGATLVCAGQRIDASTLVLSAGVWSSDLLEPLGVSLPLISERGYHVEFANPGIQINNSVLDVAGKFIASSMEGGVRAAGTSEFAHHSAPPNYERAKILKRQTKRLFPDLNTDSANRWMGVRPSLPDCLPAIGEIPSHPGVITAFGHSHWGLGMAPGTGRLITELLEGTADAEQISAVSPTRFM